MRELTSRRAVAAMPIAGSYRAIDFTLSNMSNSHIQKVAVLTQYNARSLNEHLNSSKWWDFGRKQGGLYVFTPTITADNGYWYRGTADAIYQNLDFLKRSHEPYVIITSGDAVYKMDYNKVLEYHIAKKADITVVCKELDDSEDASRFGTIKMDDSMRIEEFETVPPRAYVGAPKVPFPAPGNATAGILPPRPQVRIGSTESTFLPGSPTHFPDRTLTLSEQSHTETIARSEFPRAPAKDSGRRPASLSHPPTCLQPISL